MHSALRDKKILVTGGNGFLGSYIVQELIARGVEKQNIRTFSSRECDLRERDNCVRAVTQQNIVIHLAGTVGGIGLNKEQPATLFYDNITMGVELMEAARRTGVEKFVAIGTICAYPKFAPIPFSEDDLWNGYPEETNAAYGLAKKMLLVQAQAYRQQYGFNAIYLLPVNLYGPGDNFDPSSSHVIPALIKKIHDAKQHNAASIEVWGDGSASREFLYVADAARGIVDATESYNQPEPVNIGAGKEITIQELVTLIAKEMDFTGDIMWNTAKPNGQPRRMLDISRARKAFGFAAQTDFITGLRNTINWYRDHRV